mmetsp:Transcript_22614/g.69888  ORF Transcript_22614/g.69888 Transcript_22614/m.69888 type:complete len:216 (+) Transcript_22614:570-1217(+)
MAGGRFARPNASCTPSTQIDGALYCLRQRAADHSRWLSCRYGGRVALLFLHLGRSLATVGFTSVDAASCFALGTRGHRILLYIIGGDEPWDGTQSNDRSTRLQIFDAATRTWSVGPSLAALNRRTPDPSDTPSHNLDFPRKWSACAWSRSTLLAASTPTGRGGVKNTPSPIRNVFMEPSTPTCFATTQILNSGRKLRPFLRRCATRLSALSITIS